MTDDGSPEACGFCGKPMLDGEIFIRNKTKVCGDCADMYDSDMEDEFMNEQRN